MIRVIQAGPAGFDLALFGEQNPAHSAYFQNQLNNFNNTLNDIGSKFMEGTRKLYDEINNSDALRMARAAMRMAKGIFHPNSIVPLESIEDLRSAQPVMQRYIMAEPTLRAKFHRQLVDGYSNTYADVDQPDIGDKHYDYRRVMTGIIKDEVDEEGQDTWVAHQYYDEDRLEDRDLTSEEKFSILKTWDIVKMFTEAGKDVTDIYAKD